MFAVPHIEAAARRSGMSLRRIRYETSAGLEMVRGICFGVFFVDAIWSGSSRTSFARLTEAISRLDNERRLELVVANIDESPGLVAIPELYPIGGAGETAWVHKGVILKAARVGEDVVPNTRDLLAREPRPTVPASWPAIVVQLADALYHGEDCSFALHDALLEAGHPDLADHFNQGTRHSMMCWALDLILGGERL